MGEVLMPDKETTRVIDEIMEYFKLTDDTWEGEFARGFLEYRIQTLVNECRAIA
jgi:hypothetical protein